MIFVLNFPSRIYPLNANHSGKISPSKAFVFLCWSHTTQKLLHWMNFFWSESKFQAWRPVSSIPKQQAELNWNFFFSIFPPNGENLKSSFVTEYAIKDDKTTWMKKCFNVYNISDDANANQVSYGEFCSHKLWKSCFYRKPSKCHCLWGTELQNKHPCYTLKKDLVIWRNWHFFLEKSERRKRLEAIGWISGYELTSFDKIIVFLVTCFWSQI